MKSVECRKRKKGFISKVSVILVILMIISYACGKKDEKTQPSTKYPITIIEKGKSRIIAPSPELESALDIISKIDVETDTLKEIIEQYKQAKKQLNQKISDKTATREEKYVYVLIDSFLLLHQLFYFFNELAVAIAFGKFDTQTILKLIESLPSAPQLGSRIESLQTESDIPYGCSQLSGLAQTLCSSIDSIYLRRIEDNIKRLREIQEESEQKDSDFKIEIKTLPVKLQLVIIRADFDFGGIHDLGMVYFTESVLDIIDAIHRFIFSVNVDGVLQGVSQIPKYAEKVSFTDDPILHGGRIFTYLLKKDGSFLTVSSFLEILRTRYQLLQAIEKTQKFLDYAKSKNLNSEKAIITFDGEYYIIRYKSGGEKIEAKFLEDDTAEEFKKSVGKLGRNLGKDPAVPQISVGELVYIFSTALVAGVKTGIFNPIIDTVLNLLASQQSGFIRQILNSQFFTPEAISGLISGILGDIFYFDFGTMFDNLKDGKTHYRRWLPIWTTAFSSDAGDIIEQFGDNFVIEWDCGAKLYDMSIITNYKEGRKEFFGLACTQPKPEIDIPHFELSVTQISQELGWNSEWKIPEDGIFFKFPYILFQDPTFGGLLKLKVSGILSKAGGNQQKVSGFLSQCGVENPAGRNQPELYSERRGLCALNLSFNLILDSILGAISSSQ